MTHAQSTQSGRSPAAASSDGCRAPGVAARWLARALRPFAVVEASEAISAALLTLAVFLLLLAYYLLKTAREPLILLHGGAEVKAYASAGQSLLLLLVIPAYAALARRVGRLRLLFCVYGFFAFNLLLFAGALVQGATIGVAFYLWVGVFNNTAIAQLWSFANDIYTPEQGQRLFAILGIGSSLGAVAGAFVAKRLAGLGPLSMLLGAALLLGVCAGLVLIVHRRERAAHDRNVAQVPADRPPLDDGVLRLLLHDKYLLWIALATFLLNCVNSAGEYLLDRTLLDVLAKAGMQADAALHEVTRFKADYFGWVNLVGVLLQLFAVSRLLKLLGVRKALFVLPLVSFVSFGVMLVAPVLALIRLGKIADNSIDYSLQNTTRQALFLVGTRAEKYLGKTIIDTLVVRLGDVFAASLIFVSGRLGLHIRAFAVLILALIGCWVFVLVMLGREHRKRSSTPSHEAQEVVSDEPEAARSLT